MLRRFIGVLMCAAACTAQPRRLLVETSAVKIVNESTELVTVYAVTESGFKYRIDQITPGTTLLRWLPPEIPQYEGVRFFIHPFASSRYVGDFTTDPAVPANWGSMIVVRIEPYLQGSYVTVLP